MARFRGHDSELDEVVDHRTDFDRWLASWAWTPTARMIYVALIAIGFLSGAFKWIVGFLFVVAFITALMIGAAYQELTGTG